MHKLDQESFDGFSRIKSAAISILDFWGPPQRALAEMAGEPNEDPPHLLTLLQQFILLFWPFISQHIPDGFSDMRERRNWEAVADEELKPDARRRHLERVVNVCLLVLSSHSAAKGDRAAPSHDGGQGGDDSNVGNKMEIIMGDKYENVQGSTVVNRSDVKGSFNQTRNAHSTKGAAGGVWKWLRTGLWSFIKKLFGW